MNRNRSDLSNWIIHFVHDRNASLEPVENPDWPINNFVHSYDYNGQAIRNEYPICNDDLPLDEHAGAFQVLQKDHFFGLSESRLFF
ncbi:hypothetical protein C7475_109148 [Chitinophaga sp. S165]|nr:hypothetical protein C7475_109148 [Chitinophaga sp. S165]